MNRKVHVAYNFKYVFENEGLLKVTASHIHKMWLYLGNGA